MLKLMSCCYCCGVMIGFRGLDDKRNDWILESIMKFVILMCS